MTQARDSKGRYLYKFSVQWKNDLSTVSNLLIEYVARKKPIKRFSMVCDNMIKRKGLWACYERASLSIYEQWEQERENP